MTLSLYNGTPQTRRFLKYNNGNGENEMKFKTILMIAAMLFAIIPMVIFAVLSNGELSASGETEFRNTVISVAKNQAAPLNGVINGAKSDMTFLAGIDAVKGAAVSGSTNADADAVMKAFADNNPLVVNAVIVNNNGKIIAGTNSGSELENYQGYSSYYKDDYQKEFRSVLHSDFL